MPEHEKTSDTSVHDKQSQDDGEHASEERAAATFNKAPMVLEPVAEAKLARKIDFRLVPIVFLPYLFCFIDRANIGNARLAGLEADLGLAGYYYDTLLSVFYVAYIVFEIPSNLVCKWIGPGRWIPIMVISFGLISICTAFCRSLGSACAVRFLLVAFEAGMLPGVAGIITVGLGVIAYFFLTDSPSVVSWFTSEEKQLAEERIKSENLSSSILDKMHKKGVMAGIFSVNTLTLAFLFLLNNITVQGIAVFTLTIVRTIFPGRSTIQQQLLTVPPYVAGAGSVLLITYLGWKTDRRGLYLALGAPFVMIGYIMFLASDIPSVRYGASFLITCGCFCYGAIVSSWAAANVTCDTSRASARNALNLGTSTITLFAVLGLLLYQYRANKSHASGKNDHLLEDKTEEQQQELGVHHPEFRYRY